MQHRIPTVTIAHSPNAGTSARPHESELLPTWQRAMPCTDRGANIELVSSHDEPRQKRERAGTHLIAKDHLVEDDGKLLVREREGPEA